MKEAVRFFPLPQLCTFMEFIYSESVAENLCARNCTGWKMQNWNSGLCMFPCLTFLGVCGKRVAMHGNVNLFCFNKSNKSVQIKHLLKFVLFQGPWVRRWKDKRMTSGLHGAAMRHGQDWTLSPFFLIVPHVTGSSHTFPPKPETWELHFSKIYWQVPWSLKYRISSHLRCHRF